MDPSNSDASKVIIGHGFPASKLTMSDWRYVIESAIDQVKAVARHLEYSPISEIMLERPKASFLGDKFGSERRVKFRHELMLEKDIELETKCLFIYDLLSHKWTENRPDTRYLLMDKHLRLIRWHDRFSEDKVICHAVFATIDEIVEASAHDPRMAMNVLCGLSIAFSEAIGVRKRRIESLEERLEKIDQMRERIDFTE